MSHKKGNDEYKRPPRANRKDETSPSLIGSWEFTARLFDFHKNAVSFLNDPKVGPTDFWNMLETLDLALSIHHRLDRWDVETMPRSQWEHFLGRYIAACVTGMTRGPRFLEAFALSGIVKLSNRGGLKGKSGQRQRTSGSNDAAHADFLPSLAPIEREIPYFNGAFIGILQTRLEEFLANEELLPSRKTIGAKTAERIKRAQKCIDAERLFDITRNAAEHYFRHVYRGKDPAVAGVLAKSGAPFIFLWLMSLGLLDDLVYGILCGKPLMKKMDGRDRDGNIVFLPTEEGKNAGFSRLD